MVERIVNGGLAVLMRDGAFSTNRVATEAGVSPGSLYQYFPSKAAIIEEVIDRHSEAISDQFAAVLVDRLGEVGPTMLRRAIAALVDLLEANVVVLRVMMEELPARRHLQRRALERRVSELAAGYLAAPRPDPLHRTARTAWVLVLTVEHLATRFVLDRPAMSKDEFLDEVLLMFSEYAPGG